MTEFNYITPLDSGGAEMQPIGGNVLRWLVWGVGIVMSASFFEETGGLSIFLLLPTFLIDAWLVFGIKRQAQIELLLFYADIKEPIFEWQESQTDGEVFNRAEAHRELLAKSGNPLAKIGKIHVVEMYWRDPQFDYCETFEEFETRRTNIRRDYLRQWAKDITKDDLWRKQFLHNQNINVKEAQTA